MSFNSSSVSTDYNDNRSLNLGWMTETTHIKRPGLAIEVDTSSLLGLKATTFSTVQTLNNGIDQLESRKQVQNHLRQIRENKHLPSAAKLYGQNMGVESRASKDNYQSSVDLSIKSQVALKAKASIYEKIARGELPQDSENLLIDFERKEIIYGDHDDYNVDYSLQTQNNNSFANSSMQTSYMRQEVERQRWEEQAMKLVEGEVLANMKMAPRPTTGVRQKWEYTFSAEEKQYLNQIREDTIKEREIIKEQVELQMKYSENRRAQIAAKEARKFAFYSSLVELKEKIQTKPQEVDDKEMQQFGLPSRFS